MRYVLAVAMAAGLVAVMPIADAQAKKHKNKACVATQLDGKKQTFKCKMTERCCFDYGLNKGVCKKANEVCL